MSGWNGMARCVFDARGRPTAAGHEAAELSIARGIEGPDGDAPGRRARAGVGSDRVVSRYQRRIATRVSLRRRPWRCTPPSTIRSTHRRRNYYGGT